MSDGRKSCLGFGFLILALTLAGFSVLAGGIGSLVSGVGGNPSGLILKPGFSLQSVFLSS